MNIMHSKISIYKTKQISYLGLVLAFAIMLFAFFSYKFNIEPFPFFIIFCSLYFLFLAAWHIFSSRLLYGMALIPQTLVMLLGSALLIQGSSIDLPRFPLNLLESTYSFKFLTILLIFNSLLSVIFFFNIPKRSLLSLNQSFSRKPYSKSSMYLFLILGFLIIYLGVPGSSILTAEYASDSQRTGAIMHNPGLKVISAILVNAALIICAVNFGISSKNYRRLFIIVGLYVGWFIFLRGDRGGALPIFMCFLYLYVILSNDKSNIKMRKMLVSASLLFFVMLGMSFFRAHAANMGVMNAIFGGFSFLKSAFLFDDYYGATKAGLYTLPLLPQSFWHGMHCIDLYQQGVSLNGKSFFDIWLQLLPGPLTDLIGYERPLNGAWQLANYRIHAGGMNSAALAYWNLGITGVILFSSFFSFLLVMIENLYRRLGEFALAGYISLAGALPYLLLYGWQPLFKTILICLLMGIALGLVEKIIRSTNESS